MKMERRQPKIFTYEECLEHLKSDASYSRYIIDDVPCTIRTYCHNLEYCSITIKPFHIIEHNDGYMISVDKTKMKEIMNSSTIIVSKNGDIGTYKIYIDNSDYCFKYVEGIDVLEYNNIIDYHKEVLEKNLNLYKKIDYKKHLLVNATHNVCQRTSIQTVYDIYPNGVWDIKEHDYFDKEYFDDIIKNFKDKEFYLIREYDGSNKYSIYQKSYIYNFDIENKRIGFAVVRKDDDIIISTDLNINPLKDYNSFIRKQKIDNLFIRDKRL